METKASFHHYTVFVLLNSLLVLALNLFIYFLVLTFKLFNLGVEIYLFLKNACFCFLYAVILIQIVKIRLKSTPNKILGLLGVKGGSRSVLFGSHWDQQIAHQTGQN